MNELPFQQALFVQDFVNQNPSFREYVIKLGRHYNYIPHSELRQFCSQIMGKPSVLAIGFMATAYVFTESVQYN